MTPSPLLRKKNQRPLILGHRGARAHEPENTLSAFRRALRDGADGVELDVRTTSDGALVVAHDDEHHFPSLDRPRRISSLTLGQLRELEPSGTEPIPTLRDALHFQAETGCWMNVELKGSVPAPGYLAHEAAREIEIHGGDHLILSSFSPLIVWTLGRLLPHIPSALLLEKDQMWSGLLLPLRLLGASGAHPESAMINSALVQRLRTRGAFIGAWTVNDLSEAKRLSALGVDVLIGDDPGALLAAVG